MPARVVILVISLLVLCSSAWAGKRPEGGAGKAVKGLAVSISGPAELAAAPLVFTLTVTNVSKKPVEIVRELGSFRVVLAWPAPSREGCVHPRTSTRVLTFAQANRGQVAPDVAMLGPGEQFSVEVDLDAWARQVGNGEAPLGYGPYLVRATFGKARSRPLGFTYQGEVSGDRCRGNLGWVRWGASA